MTINFNKKNFIPNLEEVFLTWHLTIFLAVVVFRFLNDSLILLPLFDPLSNFRPPFDLEQPFLFDVLFDPRSEDVELCDDASDQPLVAFAEPLVLVGRARLNSGWTPGTFSTVSTDLLIH